MSGYVTKNLAARLLVVTSLLLLGVPPMSVADEHLPDELRRCSLIDDSADRLACYDALSGRDTPTSVATSAVAKAAQQPQPESKPIPKPIPEPIPEPISKAEKTLDDLGVETLPASADKREKIEVRATVTRCDKDARKKYLFYFENGQVWRQVSDKRIYFKDCNFDVTISKDYFGYKLQKDGDKGRIRISRLK